MKPIIIVILIYIILGIVAYVVDDYYDRKNYKLVDNRGSCVISGYSYNIIEYVDTKKKYSCIPMVLVDYNFKNMHFEKQTTKLYKYTNHDYGIRYKNISNIEIDDCISYIRDNDIYVLGLDIGNCYVTINNPIDTCICRISRKNENEIINNSCCNNGSIKSYDIMEIYCVITIFTFIVMYRIICECSSNNSNYIQLPTTIDNTIDDTPGDIIVTDIQIPDRYETHKIYNEENCVICYKQDNNVILYPCCHKCICMECANQLEQRKCPYCNIRFTDILTT